MVMPMTRCRPKSLLVALAGVLSAVALLAPGASAAPTYDVVGSACVFNTPKHSLTVCSGRASWTTYLNASTTTMANIGGHWYVQRGISENLVRYGDTVTVYYTVSGFIPVAGLIVDDTYR